MLPQPSAHQSLLSATAHWGRQAEEEPVVCNENLGSLTRCAQHNGSRRRFLTQLSLTGCALAAARAARAIDPIDRSAAASDSPGAKFKFSLAAYSYRDLLTGSSPPLTLFDFVHDCARMGLEGTELTSYYFPRPVTREYLCSLKQLCFKLGLDVSGTAVGNDFCLPPGEKRDEQLAYVKEWIDHAVLLGAPVIRIFSGGASEQVPEALARRLAVEAIEECCQYAGERGVMLALENHGGLTSTAEGMLELVRAVRSPWFGVNLDTGNFHGPDVYAELARLAPYAVNVQVQQGSGPREPADFQRLAALLREAGYRGYIVLEFEEAEDPRQACPRYMQDLRAAFGEA
jgi:sugar phosphate isomerase/epimerase